MDSVKMKYAEYKDNPTLMELSNLGILMPEFRRI